MGNNSLTFKLNTISPFSKNLVFVYPDLVKQGTPNYYIKFPLNGIMTKVSAFCLIPGTGDTHFIIEKCKKNDFIAGINKWQNIFLDRFILEKGLTYKESETYFSEIEVSADDYFRITYNPGSGIKDLTIHLEIKIN